QFGPHVVSQFKVEPPPSLDAPVDYVAFEKATRPSQVPADAWHALIVNLSAQVGSTVGQLQEALDDAATALSRLGQYTGKLEELLPFLLQQSDSPLGTLTLASTVDAAAPVPGAVPLTLDRTYPLSLVRRYQTGLFGRGWSTSWDISASSDADGNLVIQTPQGFRFFKPHAVTTVE